MKNRETVGQGLQSSVFRMFGRFGDPTVCPFCLMRACFESLNREKTMSNENKHYLYGAISGGNL